MEANMDTAARCDDHIVCGNRAAFLQGIEDAGNLRLLLHIRAGHGSPFRAALEAVPGASNMPTPWAYRRFPPGGAGGGHYPGARAYIFHEVAGADSAYHRWTPGQSPDQYGFGYILYRITNDVEELYSDGASGGGGIQPWLQTKDNLENWRWRCFQLALSLGCPLGYSTLPCQRQRAPLTSRFSAANHC